jgi:hypothetical protein
MTPPLTDEQRERAHTIGAALAAGIDQHHPGRWAAVAHVLHGAGGQKTAKDPTR